MPTTKNFKGTIENAYGKPLPTPIAYAGSFEELQKGEEIPPRETPDADDLLAYANNKRKAAARQKAMQGALDAAGIEKPTLADPSVQFKEMVKILVAAGRSDADARQMAAANLGLNVADYATA